VVADADGEEEDHGELINEGLTIMNTQGRAGGPGTGSGASRQQIMFE
jgi:hypothetical protein